MTDAGDRHGDRSRNWPASTARSRPPRAKSCLQTKDLTVKFGGLTALDSVTFDIRRGEILGLIGPNGAGKTTCFNAITGVYRPSSGSVTFDGAPLGRIKRHQITRRGHRPHLPEHPAVRAR